MNGKVTYKIKAGELEIICNVSVYIPLSIGTRADDLITEQFEDATGFYLQSYACDVDTEVGDGQTRLVRNTVYTFKVNRERHPDCVSKCRQLIMLLVSIVQEVKERFPAIDIVGEC